MYEGRWGMGLELVVIRFIGSKGCRCKNTAEGDGGKTEKIARVKKPRLL